jgi:hypothetical protein
VDFALHINYPGTAQGHLAVDVKSSTLSTAVSVLRVRFWHKADMPSGTAHVRFRG